MNKLFTILFFTAVTYSQAQDLIQPVYTTDSSNHEIKIRFQGYYHTQKLTNDFTRLFYKGGYLDTTLKNSISENLLSDNRAGLELVYGISYRNHKSHLFGKPQWGWYASAEDVLFAHGQFSENAFNLLFYGNSRFAGDTVDLHAVGFESIQYQKFTFGGFHKTNHSYVGISFLKGQNYSQLNIDQASLYTAPLGEEISLDLNAQYTQSDTAQKKAGAFNGWGLSTDLVFYLNIGKNRNVKFENAFRIAIQDLGFIRWNDKSTVTSLDSNYYFNGFEVDDLFDSTSYNFSERMKDSLAVNPRPKAITMALPFSFSFAKIADPNSTDKFQGIYGFRMRAFSYYKPLFYAGLYYHPAKSISMNIYGSVGGYGLFRVGYGFHAQLFEKLNFSLSSTDLIGWSKKGYGKDLTIQISYAF